MKISSIIFYVKIRETRNEKESKLINYSQSVTKCQTCHFSFIILFFTLCTVFRKLFAKKIFTNARQRRSRYVHVKIHRTIWRGGWNRCETRASWNEQSRFHTARPWSVISRQLLARQEVRHHTCALALTFLHNVKSGTEHALAARL